MRQLLTEIGYDFDNFTLDNFVDWIRERRGRKLTFLGRSMPPNLYGAWLQTAHEDFIFYDNHVSEVHRLHIQLHEMAHMLCGHSQRVLAPEEVALILRQDADLLALLGILRSDHTDDKEREAETLAGLIYEQIARHRRLEGLTHISSTQSPVASYWRMWE